jgi:hypothetical protein
MRRREAAGLRPGDSAAAGLGRGDADELAGRQRRAGAIHDQGREDVLDFVERAGAVALMTEEPDAT